MPRVKKIMKASGGDVIKKSSYEDVFGEDTPQTEPTQTNPTQTAIPQTPQQHSVNVAGYGDIVLDDEAKRFITEKMNSFTGDQNIKNQLGYVSDLYSKGGLSSINEAGIGSGADDLSLTNRKASRRQFWTGNSKDYNRQQAAAQYNKWLQEYAQMKHAEKNKPKAKTDYTFDIKSDVYKRSGDTTGGYFGTLTHGDRRQFVEGATEDWLKRINEGGDWTDETHSGNKDLYNRLRTGGDEFRNDLKTMLDTGLADANLENAEMSGFVSKWGINPWELFGAKTQTAQEIEAEKVAKAKSEEEKLTAQNALQKEISDLRSKYDVSGAGFTLNEPEDSKDWTPTNWDEYLRNPSNYTQGDYTGYYEVDPWDEDRYGMFRGRYVRGKKLADDEIHGEYDAAVQTQIAPMLIAGSGTASPTRSRLFEKHPELKNYGHAETNVYDIKLETYPSFKGDLVSFVDSKGDRTGMAIKEPGSNSFSKIISIRQDPNKKGYYIAKVMDSSGATKEVPIGYSSGKRLTGAPSKLYTPSVTKQKNGGKINFKKIDKFQFGGRVTNYMADEATAQKYNQAKDFEKKRSAYMSGEVFGDTDNNFKLRTADKVKLGALLADLGGLAATAAPGIGNAWGAGIGAVGTIANLGADIADMENTGKSGWDVAKDAGIGLALDAATFIPGLGSGAKTSKIVKGIKSAWNVIQPALSVYGAANSLPAFQKLMSDEKLTIDDYRQIAQGLTAITGGAKGVAKKMATKNQVVASDIKLKGGEKLRFDKAEQGADFIKKQDAFKKANTAKADIEAKLRNENLTPEARAELDAKLTKADTDLTKAKEDLSNLSSQGKVINKKGEHLQDYDLSDVGNTAVPSREGIGLTMKSPFRKPNDDAKFWERIKRPLPFGYSERTPGVTTERVWKSSDELQGLDRLAAKWVKSPKLKGNNVDNTQPDLNRPQAEQPSDNTAPAETTPVAETTPKLVVQQVPKKRNVRELLALPQGRSTVIPESRRLGQGTPIESGKVYAMGTGETPSSGQVYHMPERIGQKALPAPERKALPPATKKAESVKPKSKDLDSLTKDEFYKHGKRLRKQMQGAKKNKSSDSSKKEKQFKEALALFKSKFPGVPSFEKGGILKFQSGGVSHVLGTVNKTMPDYLKEGVEKVVTPSALKFLNTASTNRQLMGKIKEMPRPVNTIAPTTTKLKNVGMGSAMTQYNQIGAQENSMQPMYSDPKLNAAVKLAAGANANQMRNQIGQQIQAQNQQIDATNAQLYSQDAATRAQTSAQNAAQQRQHSMMMNQYEQGLIRSQGQSRENLLSEWQHKRTQDENRNKQIDDQLNMMTAEAEFAPQIKSLDAKYPNRASDPTQASAYQEELATIKKNARIKYLESKKAPTLSFSKGGSISDKKELAEYKAEMKRVANHDKAFNKMIQDKSKSHEKVLSLLLKNKIK